MFLVFAQSLRLTSVVIQLTVMRTQIQWHNRFCMFGQSELRIVLKHNLFLMHNLLDLKSMLIFYQFTNMPKTLWIAALAFLWVTWLYFWYSKMRICFCSSHEKKQTTRQLVHYRQQPTFLELKSNGTLYIVFCCLAFVAWLCAFARKHFSAKWALIAFWDDHCLWLCII